MRPSASALVRLVYLAALLFSPTLAWSQDTAPQPDNTVTTTTTTAPTPTHAPPTAPWVERDRAIASQLDAIYGRIEALGSVEVDSTAGLVTLSGEVAEQAQRERAEQIAERVEGVIDVQNLLELPDGGAIDPKAEQTANDLALRARIEKIFATTDDLTRVEVSVEDGIVTLSGEVPTTEAGDEAKSLVEKLDGDAFVIDNTTLPLDVADRMKPAWEQLQGMLRTFFRSLPLIGIALLTILVTWMISRWVRTWSWPYRRLSRRPLMRELARQIVGIAILVAGLIVTFELLGITSVVGAVLGTAGLAGLAISFAFKDIVENYLSSLMLSARQPYRKGDVIEIDSHLGKVMRMTMRDTVLMTFDGNHVRVPNAQVFKSALTNYSHNPKRRFECTIGVGTDENLIDVQRVGLETLTSIDGVLADPNPFMAIDDLGDSNVICKFYAWIDQRSTDYLAVRTEAIRRLKVRFEREGFDLPEPIYRLNVRNAPASSEVPEKPRSSANEDLDDSTLQRAIQEGGDLDQQVIEEDERGEENLL